MISEGASSLYATSLQEYMISKPNMASAIIGFDISNGKACIESVLRCNYVTLFGRSKSVTRRRCDEPLVNIVEKPMVEAVKELASFRGCKLRAVSVASFADYERVNERGFSSVGERDVSADGPSTGLIIARHGDTTGVAPSMNKPWAESDRNKAPKSIAVSSIPLASGIASPYLSSSLPSVYASTLNFSGSRLISTLQTQYRASGWVPWREPPRSSSNHFQSGTFTACLSGPYLFEPIQFVLVLEV